MTHTVGMYTKSYDTIRDRLDALGLDITVLPFTLEGKLIVDGRETDPGDVDLDYLWFGPDLSADGGLGKGFEIALTCRSLGVLQTFNAGLDNPLYADVAKRGTRICNSSAQAVAISEYVMAQVFALFQPIVEQRELQAGRQWRRTPFREISGSNWLIVGFGPIGRATAARAKAFGATISVIRRSPEAGANVDRVGTREDLTGFLADADVIVLACPLNDTTRGMADDAFFESVKPGAILVNIARGGLIDDTAMIAALDNGHLANAILDVFHTEPLPETDPLWSHPKIRLTSHTSFAGSGGRNRWEALFLDNIQRFTSGEPLVNEVSPADI